MTAKDTQVSRTAGTVPLASVIGAVPGLRFDREARAVLEQALQVALQERAEHIGTSTRRPPRTGPPVVAWPPPAATAEAVDACSAYSAPGVERLRRDGQTGGIGGATARTRLAGTAHASHVAVVSRHGGVAVGAGPDRLRQRRLTGSMPIRSRTHACRDEARQ
jgi:hypothetical protein